MSNQYMVKRIQEILKSMLLYTGKIDAIIGAKTISAIDRYRKMHSLPAFGSEFIDEDLLNSMGILPIADRQLKEVPFDTISDIESIYGKVGTNQVKLVLPYKMKLAWNTNVVISSFVCHKKAKNDLESIFRQTLEHYSGDGIRELGLDLFGGCYNKRKIRGGDRWSTHAYSIAVDLNPLENQLHWGKDRAVFAKPRYDKFWDIVYKNNFYSLGKEKNYDFMHIQRAIPV